MLFKGKTLTWQSSQTSIQDHSSPFSPPVETQVLSVAQGRLHCCVRRLACLEQLTQVPGSPLNALGSNNPTPSYTALVIRVQPKAWHLGMCMMRIHRLGVVQMLRSIIGLSNTALNSKEFVVAAAVVMSRSFQAGAVLPIFHQALVRQWKQINGHAAMLLNGRMHGGTYKTNGMNYD